MGKSERGRREKAVKGGGQSVSRSAVPWEFARPSARERATQSVSRHLMADRPEGCCCLSCRVFNRQSWGQSCFWLLYSRMVVYYVDVSLRSGRMNLRESAPCQLSQPFLRWNPCVGCAATNITIYLLSPHTSPPSRHQTALRWLVRIIIA